MSRITKEPEVRRQEILDTAMKLFYEKGYEKTSITDIAREMGVAQGLCYRYFSSKEMIFDSALDQYAKMQAAQLTRGMLESEYSLKQMICEMPTFLDVEKDDNFYYKVCHGEEGAKTHQQLSMKICEKMLPVIEQLLDRAVEKMEIEPMDTHVAASFCVYGQLGILLDQSISGGERVIKIKEFLLRMLNLA